MVWSVCLFAFGRVVRCFFFTPNVRLRRTFGVKKRVSSTLPHMFEYQVTRDQKVLIYWDNRLVVTLANEKARKFLCQLDETDAASQLVMARFTGNFKRGNEREGKNTR